MPFVFAPGLLTLSCLQTVLKYALFLFTRYRLKIFFFKYDYNNVLSSSVGDLANHPIRQMRWVLLRLNVDGRFQKPQLTRTEDHEKKDMVSLSTIARVSLSMGSLAHTHSRRWNHQLILIPVSESKAVSNSIISWRNETNAFYDGKLFTFQQVKFNQKMFCNSKKKGSRDCKHFVEKSWQLIV